jgi:ribose transport system ATP-binding protein
MGAGRTELLESIFGLNSTALKGSMTVQQKSVKIQTPKDAIANGIAFVTEDRKTEGLVLGMNIASNISLTTLTSDKLLDARQEQQNAQSYIDSLAIKTLLHNSFV